MVRVSANDEVLIAGLLRGEEAAIEALVDRYGAWVNRVAGRLLADSRDTEEVTQDVLLTVVKKIGTFKRESAFSSWLYRITANTAYERLRSRRSRADVPLDPLLPVFDEEGRHAGAVRDWSRDVDDPAVAAEVRAALEWSIGQLPEEHRVVLLLRDVEGMTNEEVADAVGISTAATKSRLHRARLALRQQLAHLFTPPS